MKKDLISIIIPIYNVEKYLNKCIDSVINQTYKNLEIILVNDGSTDNCGNICDQYKKIDKRIKVIHKKNGGVSSARNVALSNIKGEYIYFIDSDDYIEKDTIELLFNNIIEFDSDIACCNYYKEYDNEKKDIIISNLKQIMNREEFLNSILNDNSISGYLWNKLYKRELFDKNIRFDESIKIMEDLIVNLNITKNISKISYVDKPLYHYVQRSNSALNSKDILKMKGSLNSYVQIIELLGHFEHILINKYKLNFIIEYLIIKIYSKEFDDRNFNIIINDYIKLGILKTKGNLKLKIKAFVLLYCPFIYKTFVFLKNK